MKFFQEIVTGVKVLLRNDQVVPIEIAKLHEFKTEVALVMIKQSTNGEKCKPSNWFKPNARVCRSYLWTVLNSVHNDWVTNVVNHAY